MSIDNYFDQSKLYEECNKSLLWADYFLEQGRKDVSLNLLNHVNSIVEHVESPGMYDFYRNEYLSLLSKWGGKYESRS